MFHIYSFSLEYPGLRSHGTYPDLEQTFKYVTIPEGFIFVIVVINTNIDIANNTNIIKIIIIY